MGKQSVEDWLFTMKAYFAAQNIEKQLRIPYAFMLLEGNARIWWKSQVKNGTESKTWKNFQKDISQQFSRIDESRKARDRLRKLSQKTSVQQYIAEFNALVYEINDITDSEKYHRFKDGLKWQVKNEMDRLDINADLTTLMRKAQQFDDLQFYQRTSAYSSNRPFDSTKNYNGRPDNHSPNKPFNKKNFHQVDRDKSSVECFYCKKKGHFMKDCRSKAADEGTRPPNNSYKPKAWKKSDKTKSTSTYPDTRKKLSKITKEEEPVKEINIINYQVLHPDATEPERKTPLAAGYDLIPCENGRIEPGEKKKIPIGLSIELPPYTFGFITARSSVTEAGLHLMNGILDADYTGQIWLQVINQSNVPLTYKAHGNALAQLVIIPFYSD